MKKISHQPLQPPDLSWYVARVRPGHEVDATVHLKRVGFDDVFCPLRRTSHVIRGRRVERIGALISGYVLCRTFAFTPWLWHEAVPGEGSACHGLVSGFLGAWPPDPVDGRSVVELRAQCDAEGCYTEPPVAEEPRREKGDLVYVLDDRYGNHVFTVVRDYGHRVEVRGPGVFGKFDVPRVAIVAILGGQKSNTSVYQAREGVDQIAAAPEQSDRALHRPTRRGRRGGHQVRSIRAALRSAS